MAYFDNAATTFPKPESIYQAMNAFYQACAGSFGRGQYKESKVMGNVVEATRCKLKELFHCPTKSVIFEPTATLSLNIIIQGLIKRGAKNIYISPFEHNAVTRTLHAFEKENKICVQKLTVSSNLMYDLQRIKFQFDDIKPDAVIISHASNVIGLVAPVLDIFALAKQYDATTVVDMSQTAGLVDINLGLETIDFAVFAGHKTLMGPTGISGFVMRSDFDLPPILYGGTGFESANQEMPNVLPQRYEMGTMNVVGVVGLQAALEWIQAQTIDAIRKKEIDNRNILVNILKNYDFIRPVGINPNCEYVGIVSCLIDGISSESAGTIFSERNISVRTGLHCAPLAHQFLRTYPAGTIRFSVTCLTGDTDFKELESALNDIQYNL